MKKKRTSRPALQDGPELLYGIHPVMESMAAGRREIRCVLIRKEKADQRIAAVVARAESLGVTVRPVEATLLDARTRGALHQGVAAETGPFPYAPDSLLLDPVTPDAPPPPALILDSILDPQNLGALLRTALCSGVTAAVLPKDRSALPSPAVSRASAGAMEHLPVIRVTNLVRYMEQMKTAGIWIAGLDRREGSPLYFQDLSGPLAVVVGGEEKGIRPLVRKTCDTLMSIPQKGPLNSLNASAAGAVVLYETLRQRMAVTP